MCTTTCNYCIFYKSCFLHRLSYNGMPMLSQNLDLIICYHLGGECYLDI